LGEGLAHDVGGRRHGGLISRIDADLPDPDSLRSEPAGSALDDLPDGGEGIRSRNERLAVLGNGFSDAGIITVTVADLAVQRQPSGALGAAGELAELVPSCRCRATL